jgi:hypothetical protein
MAETERQSIERLINTLNEGVEMHVRFAKEYFAKGDLSNGWKNAKEAYKKRDSARWWHDRKDMYK